MKQALSDGKMRVYHCTIQDAVDMHPKRTFTVASLSDHLDWFNEDAIEEELRALWNRLHPTKGRILWRSFSEQLPNCHVLEKMNVRDCKSNDDRMPLYWSCWVASCTETT